MRLAARHNCFSHLRLKKIIREDVHLSDNNIESLEFNEMFEMSARKPSRHDCLR